MRGIAQKEIEKQKRKETNRAEDWGNFLASSPVYRAVGTSNIFVGTNLLGGHNLPPPPPTQIEIGLKNLP